MNDIPAGVIVFLSFIVVIIGVLLYGFMGDMLAKHTRKEAIRVQLASHKEDSMARMWRKMREEDEIHRKKMRVLAAARRRREARQANRRRFLGSHR